MILYTSKSWRVPEPIEKDKNIPITILKSLLQPLHDIRIIIILLLIGITFIVTGIIIVMKFYRKIAPKEVRQLPQP
ncbi:hypothetical protein Igag_1201 [Ignisphaera aggregans DSM 17230]|uniref:Uncharacterized protein n=1 Tax=Ignisphaera aggregans (strain DSM 17230 / JCM 13409 / AQ1.S1) TaxID=583356 RepID=E0SP80_IGNAA|nr:hypothetical protein Igag_1201 [Ignisphaera aggregans DSM 17230]